MAHTDASSCNDKISENLGYLSAEEQACLMFLEKTIESLEVEEDSGLSRDQADQLPVTTGNVAAKVAQLSLFMAHHKQNGVMKRPGNNPKKLVTKDVKPSVNSCVDQPKDGPKLSSKKVDFSSNPEMTTEVSKSHQITHLVPSETKILTTTSSKVIEGIQNNHKCDPAASRELLEIGKGTSVKNNTIIFLPEAKSRHSSSSSIVIHPRNGSGKAPALKITVPPTVFNKYTMSRSNPPVVLHEPIPLPSSMLHKTSAAETSGVDSNKSCVATSPNGEIVMDTQRVRAEALRKLGLLLRDDDDPKALLDLPLSGRRHQSLEPPLVYPDTNISHRVPGNNEPIPNSHSTKESETRSVKPQPTRLIGMKSATLECSELGLAGSISSQASSNYGFSKDVFTHNLNGQPQSLFVGSKRDFEDVLGGQHFVANILEPEKAVKASHSVQGPHGVSVVTKARWQTEKDRQEALQKLGLLKK